MPTSVGNALDLFFEVVNQKLKNGSASPHYGDVDFLMNSVFSADSAGSTIPCVGITDHGPQFQGADDVYDLFDKLLHRTFAGTFFISPRLSKMSDPNIVWSKYLYSTDGTTAGVQTLLGGTQTGRWFQHNEAVTPHNPHPKDHYSKPISDIAPNRKKTELPADAAFTFNKATFKINQLSMYFDRDRMNQDLKA